MTNQIEQQEEVSREQHLRPYLEKFRTWAVAMAKAEGMRSGAYINSESLRSWDAKYNHRLIEKSFGSDEDIREAGIRALYTRVLGKYLQVDMVLAMRASLVAEPNYSRVDMGTVRRGVCLADCPEEERLLVIEAQAAVMRNAAKRMAYYKMPLDRLNQLFRELEEIVRESDAERMTA